MVVPTFCLLLFMEPKNDGTANSVFSAFHFSFAGNREWIYLSVVTKLAICYSIFQTNRFYTVTRKLYRCSPSVYDVRMTIIPTETNWIEKINQHQLDIDSWSFLCVEVVVVALYFLSTAYLMNFRRPWGAQKYKHRINNQTMKKNQYTPHIANE